LLNVWKLLKGVYLALAYLARARLRASTRARVTLGLVGVANLVGQG